MCTSISLCFYTIVVLFSKKKERKCHDAINNVYDRTRTVINQSDHDFVICILTTIGGESRPEKKSEYMGKKCDMESQYQKYPRAGRHVALDPTTYILSRKKTGDKKYMQKISYMYFTYTSTYIIYCLQC